MRAAFLRGLAFWMCLIAAAFLAGPHTPARPGEQSLAPVTWPK